MDLGRMQKALGVLGMALVLLSAAWWGVLLASLPDAGPARSQLMKQALACLYSMGDSCTAIWHFSEAGLPAYTPVFLWLGIILLTVNTVLRFASSKERSSVQAK